MRVFSEPEARAQVFVAAILFAAVGLYARWVPFSALVLSFGRGIFATLVLGVLILALKRRLPRLSARQWCFVALVVGGTAGNWTFYFAAIQVSSLSVAVVALFTYPFMHALVEPLLFRERLSGRELIAGLLVIVGVGCIASTNGAGGQVGLGILFGLAAGASFVVRNLASRVILPELGSLVIMLYGFGFTTLLFLPFGAPTIPDWTLTTWAHMFVLGALLTATSQTAFVNSLKVINARTASLIVSTQPVFAILFGVTLLGEPLTWQVVVGAAFVVSSVALISWRSSTSLQSEKERQQNSSEQEPKSYAQPR